MTDLKPNGRIRLTAVLPADQLDAAADRLGKCLLSLGVYPSEVTVKAGDIDMTLHHANRPKAPKQLVSAKDLPVPRLELRWNSPEEAPPEGYPSGTQVCRYLLVIPLGKWMSGVKTRIVSRCATCTRSSWARPFAPGVFGIWCGPNRKPLIPRTARSHMPLGIRARSVSRPTPPAASKPCSSSLASRALKPHPTEGMLCEQQDCYTEC